MRHSQEGFTLLEVMVAFIIAALALGILYKGAIGGLVSALVGTQYEEAVSRARSRLEAIGHGSPIVPGEQSGDDGGGFRWLTRITATGTSTVAAPPGSVVPTLYAVQVSIAWGEPGSQRRLELDSKRVGFTAVPGP